MSVEILLLSMLRYEDLYICGFGGMHLKIEMDLKMAKTKIDFLLIYHPTVTVDSASSL
jgi:hypothetical protein